MTPVDRQHGLHTAVRTQVLLRVLVLLSVVHCLLMLFLVAPRWGPSWAQSKGSLRRLLCRRAQPHFLYSRRPSPSILPTFSTRGGHRRL